MCYSSVSIASEIITHFELCCVVNQKAFIFSYNYIKILYIKYLQFLTKKYLQNFIERAKKSVKSLSVAIVSDVAPFSRVRDPTSVSMRAS